MHKLVPVMVTMPSPQHARSPPRAPGATQAVARQLALGAAESCRQRDSHAAGGSSPAPASSCAAPPQAWLRAGPLGPRQGSSPVCIGLLQYVQRGLLPPPSPRRSCGALPVKLPRKSESASPVLQWAPAQTQVRTCLRRPFLEHLF